MREAIPRGRASLSPFRRGLGQGSEGRAVLPRLLGVVLSNPLRSGVVLVALLTASAIATNALFLQSARHPSPFFASAPAPVIRPVVAPLAKEVVAVRPAEKPAAAPAVANPARPASGANEETRLIAEIQRALAAQGLYSGTLDGIWGSRTRTAALAFQQKAGLSPTGEPSAALLARLSASPEAKDNLTTASVEGDKRLRAIQNALNLAGYGPLRIDGAMSPVMADSIRRFELDNGLAITGNTGPDVVKRLQTIGALGAL